MKNDWRIQHKPYDLRERLFQFACIIVRLVEFLHTRGPVAKALSEQILRCGTSPGANYEEADDGSSDRQTRSMRQIALREMKETRYRLRVIRATGYLTSEHDPVINESVELTKILATLAKKHPDGR